MYFKNAFFSFLKLSSILFYSLIAIPPRMMEISPDKKALAVVEQAELKQLLKHTDELIYQFQYFPEQKIFTLPFASSGLWNTYEVMPEEVKYDATPAISRIHKDDIEKVFTLINKSMKTLESWTCDYRVVLPIKGVRWLRGYGRPIQLADGSLLWNGFVTDITNQKKEEEETKRMFNALKVQNERLQNFAHIATHNLRSHSNNLSILLGLAEEEKNPEEKKEIMQHVRRVSEEFSNTMLHLNQIVTVQNNKNGALKSVNLHTYIEDVRAVLKGIIYQKKAVIINNVSKDIFIEYNPAYLESILLNLMSNALKYSHPTRHPEVLFDAFYEDTQLFLQISDNGTGIDLKKYGGHLFGMYKTFHKNEDAVGIGLFLTKSQIEAMGGDIKVASTVDVGTSFTICFNQKSTAKRIA